MPPTLILIRHAEAEHNATSNWNLADPELTANGLEQCKALEKRLREACPLASRVERIISSPMKRTCQTTLNALSWLVNSGVPVELDAMWQENSNKNCDTGSNLKELSQRFPELDFSHVDPTYPDKSERTPYAYAKRANRKRGEHCLENLYARPEKVIVVVSHAGFLRTGISHRRFANADYRCFEFVKDADGRLGLLEDPETEKSGGGMGRSEKGVFSIQAWDFPPEVPER
ncbi:hypothetical protein CERZMDRAFT_111703 [Cercospora zeae-maydis SCOH1-5]|uniref:Phosphoglycerate mutase-like protein n=1 Tax=Cercospora zeae-maydis SCOH1-5 TaxID=717836 RepID=A0A6A6FH33_9PEZI|nr:hypothetical protein CERZMDRAFT_111703 [Cercospora zeae-maydis SCOH1-5]